MTTNRPLRVFLCYSKNDAKIVRDLYEKLRAEPWIQPWLDEEELFPGMDWNLEIQKAIRETDAIIVCLSNGSITKEGYVQREIKTALDYSDEKPEGMVYVIPIRLEECEPPQRLSKWHYADYFEGQRERGLQRLLVSLKRRADSLDLKFKQPLSDKNKSNTETEMTTSAPAESKPSDWYPIIKGKLRNKPSQKLAQFESLSQAKGALDRGEFPEALSRYSRFIKKGIHLQETIRDLTEALNHYPKEIGLWQTLGDAYMRSNRLNEALEAYNRSEKLSR
jgi:tetratricopeptide (TPR) repeat protein